MKVDEFINDLLAEVKDLKDLAKEQLPLVAQEYIEVNKKKMIVGLSVGASLLLLSLSSGLYAYFGKFSEFSTKPLLFVLLAALSGLIGTILTFSSLDTFIDFKYQPRRMAIKAITSLKD